jgi:hypothetical protein
MKRLFVLFLLTMLCILFSSAYATIPLSQVSIPDMGYNETHYEYVMSVDVLCDEYKGNARFELPDTFLDSHRYDSNRDLTIEIASNREYYTKHTNWFVTEVEGYDIRASETIFDGNLRTNLIVKDSAVTLPFRNPSAQKVSRVTVQVTDSLLDSIILTANGKSVPYVKHKVVFHTA